MRLNLKDPCKAPRRLVGWTQLKIPDVSQCPGAEAPSPSIVWEPLSVARASPPGPAAASRAAISLEYEGLLCSVPGGSCSPALEKASLGGLLCLPSARPSWSCFTCPRRARLSQGSGAPMARGPGWPLWAPCMPLFTSWLWLTPVLLLGLSSATRH